MTPKHVVVFEYPKEIQNELLSFNVLIVGLDFLNSLNLIRRERFPNDLSHAEKGIEPPLGCDRLNRVKRQFGYVFLRGAGKWNRRESVSNGGLHIGGGSSTAIEEHNYRLNRLILIKLRERSILNSNPSTLFLSEGGLSVPDGSSCIVSSGLQLVNSIGHPVVNILGSVRELLSSISLVAGSVGHLSHSRDLSLGSDSQIVSVSGTTMNLYQSPTSDYDISNCCQHGDARERYYQLVIQRHRSPFLLNSSLLGWAALFAGACCCACGCYMLLLWLCFTSSLRFLAAGLSFFVAGIALLNLALWILLYNKNSLTRDYYCNTVIGMANVLPKDKQIAVIGALAEGSSIRSIERITGVHRDTIMRLAVRAGKGCELLLDSKMQDLGCRYLQMDEVWGFIGKKERHVRVDDDPAYGDVWTYCVIDSETKIVPSFKCGKRNLATTTAFVQDVASRMRNRVQISTDALHGYAEAVERAFGADVDYGQIVKVYTHDDAQHPERKYSAPHFASAMRRPIAGEPEMELVSTSHIERLNATTRLHVKRLSRLTLAFSKKFENFQAAVALHFAYYNFVRRHNTLRCTPAMAAGVERDFWSVGDLVEAVV